MESEVEASLVWGASTVAEASRACPGVKGVLPQERRTEARTATTTAANA
jgi:hypothetical protein